MALSAFGNSTSSCMSGRRGRGGERGIGGGQGEGEGVRKVGQVQLGRAAAAAWAPAQRTRAVCGCGGRGVQAKTQSATCLGGGGGVAITCSKEMHYQDYCRDDAQKQVAVRLRIMHCLPECLPTQYAPAGPFPPAACHHPSSVQLRSKFSKTTHQPLQAFIKPECASTQSISR